ncbi:MAG: DUF6287 domain-containing protein [Bacillota bacterium]|nr:DUF6287 domain-containing protein [Bacillota bacterium]
MKSFFVLALILVPMLSLASCGNNDNTSSNNSSVSINASTPSDESSVSSQSSSVSSSTSTSVSTNTSSSTQDIQGTGMNLTQIQAGDYSSLLGTWTGVAYAVNPHNGTGEQWKAGSLSTLSVSSDKIVYGNGDLVIQGNTLKDSAGSHTLSFKNNGGSLDASLTDEDVANNWYVSFYQIGVTNNIQPNNGVKIDNTKNLIVIWTSNNGLTEVFESKVIVQGLSKNAEDNATTPNRENEVFYGNWRIEKILADDVKGKFSDEIKNMVGKKVSYSKEQVSLGDKVWKSPAYNKTVISDDNFQSGNSRSFISIGIKEPTVIQVQADIKYDKISWQTISLFLVKNNNTLILFHQGVYFEVNREQ